VPGLASFRTALLLGLLGFAFPDGARAALVRGSCGFHGVALTHGDRSSRQIALTFDLCPTSHHPGYASEIVALLKERRVPTTFFVTGRWATAHPAPLRELEATDGFELALHGNLHRHLTRLSELAIAEEIDSGRRTLQSLGARPVDLFRPPYGETPGVLAPAAERTGVSVVLWDVVSGDPDRHLTSSRLVRRVLRARGGSIVVMHANGAGIRRARDLSLILDGLEREGYEFVTVGTLLDGCQTLTTPPSG
jgi:peptidoglycan/xylan/chitin deacetylase (PgdA/CDA1 family)